MTRLLIVDSLGYGGLEKNVYDLVRNYPKKFLVVCVQKKGYFGKLLEKSGFKIIELKGNKFKKIKQLRSLIKKEKIKTIVSENTAQMQLSVLGSLGFNIRRIHVDHNSFAEGSSLRVDLENRLFSKFIHQFITISPGTKEMMIKSWGIKKQKIKIIYNGVDINEIESKSNSNKRFKGKIVSVIAGLRRVKDHSTVLKAFKDIDATLLIIGDGPLRKKLEEEIYGLGIKHKVNMMGWRNDVPSLIKNSDVVVCSSLSEGISLTLLEAMALGKPIIATNVGGNKILVKNNGLLFKPGDYKILNRCIKRVLSDSSYARKLGLNGRERVEEYFNIRKMVEGYFKYVG